MGNNTSSVTEKTLDQLKQEQLRLEARLWRGQTLSQRGTYLALLARIREMKAMIAAREAQQQQKRQRAKNQSKTVVTNPVAAPAPVPGAQQAPQKQLKQGSEPKTAPVRKSKKKLPIAVIYDLLLKMSSKPDFPIRTITDQNTKKFEELLQEYVQNQGHASAQDKTARIKTVFNEFKRLRQIDSTTHAPAQRNLS